MLRKLTNSVWAGCERHNAGALAAVLCVFGFVLPLSAVDKSGVTPNTISLPKGPGSIEGLGESFEPALNNGTAKYSVPLKLPPGTAGHAPALSLHYDSGNANGPLGFGWEVPIPYVQRQTDKGIPRYVDTANGADDDLDGAVDEPDEVDRFIEETKEELVPVTNGFYFCENEGSFVRYQRTNDYWIGTRPDGTRLVFGSNTSARVSDTVTSRVFRWLLEQEIDTHGNTIAYAYTNFPGTENANQVYLAGLRYGPGAPPWGGNFHFVVFQYGSRPDWFEDGRAGFLVCTGMRLTNIVVGTRLQGVTLPGHAVGNFSGDGLLDSLNRRYSLTYLPIAASAANGSYLSAVTPFGADGDASLPPTTFDYGVSDPPESVSAADRIIGSLCEPPAVMDNPLVDLLDLNGDGLPDILKTATAGGPHLCWLNRGQTAGPEGSAVTWDGPHEVGSADGLAWQVNLEDTKKIAHLADLDGDGVSDLWFKDAAEQVHAFRNTAVLSWGPRQNLSVQDFTPPAPFGDANVTIADVDFDKRIDIVKSVDVGGMAAYQIWYNLGDQRYSARQTVLQEHALLFGLANVELTDFNGDRVPDITRIRMTSVEVGAGTGYGRFDPVVTIPIPDAAFSTEQLAKAKLRDITGDGLPDLVVERAAPGTLWYWVNLGNRMFGSKKVITGLPASIGVNVAVRWADLNGNGTEDLIYADSAGSPRLQAVDIGELIGCGAGRNLLNLIDNGIGGRTRIQYGSSTANMLADWTNANARAWPDPLPFPVTVIARVTRDDSLGHAYTNDYAYHDGYYDAVEKEFRGFARVEVIEQGDESAPSLVSRSYFDTGKLYEALKGKALRLTAAQTNGLIFRDSFTAWSAPPRLLMTGIDSREIRFAHATASSNVISELGQGEPRVLYSEMAFDIFGNQTLTADFGIVTNGDLSVWDDERIITSAYAVNTNAWILRALARRDVRDEQGAIIARTQNYYDDDTFSGANLGQVTRGDLTMTRSWVDATNETAYVNTVRNSFDAFGNVAAIRDALWQDGTADGHIRSIVWDARFCALPVTETLHTGKGDPATLVILAAYDLGLGVVTASTEPNGFETVYRYDAFGRQTSVTRPGDTVEKPTSSFEYELSKPVAGGTLNWIETRQRETAGGGTVDSRTFFDGLGRKIMTRAEGEFESQIVVSDTVQFNARGKPRRTFLPYFETGTLAFVFPPLTNGCVENFYDALGREIRANQPADTNGVIVYSTVDYAPLSRTVHDEEQTDPASPHYGCGIRYVTDGLKDKDGNNRLREVYEIVKLTDAGETGALTEWKTAYTYDLLDNWTGYTDAQNNRKFVNYDGLGRKVFMNDPDRGYLWWAYDGVGNVLRRRDAKGQEIAYAYDGLNRQVSEYYCVAVENLGNGLQPGSSWTVAASALPADDPDVAYHYDTAAGPVDRGTWWAKGYASEIADAILNGRYDPAHDRNGDGVVDVADAVTAARATGSVTAENVRGRLSWIRDQSGEEHNSYDCRGRVGWIVKRIRPAAEPLQNFFTGFSYDSLDRVTALTYPDRTVLPYAYNSRGLLEGMSNIVSQIDYNPAGQNARLDLACGTSTVNDYDHRLRLKRLRTARNRDGQVLQDFGYAFDRASNITGINDGRPDADLVGIGSELSIGADEARKFNTSQSFLYDSLYRLTQASNAGVYGTIDHRYDRIGNMVLQDAALSTADPLMDLGVETSGGSAGTWNRGGRTPGAQPGPHAITGTTRGPGNLPMSFSYDDNGNMTTNDGAIYTWDHNDRLVSVRNGSTNAFYTYDYTGTRKTKGVSTNFPVLASRPSALYIDQFSEVRDVTLTKYVYAGANRIARSSLLPTSTTAYSLQPTAFFLHDHLGSTQFAVSTNATALEQCVNYPFGYPRLERYASESGKIVEYGFVGKERDVESGLYYFEARYMCSHLASFSSVDPVNSSARDVASSTPYIYTSGRPLMRKDPSGEFEIHSMDAYAIHGRYCGPGWTGEEWTSAEDLTPDQIYKLPPPEDKQDAGCMLHDLRHAIAKSLGATSGTDIGKSFMEMADAELGEFTSQLSFGDRSQLVWATFSATDVAKNRNQSGFQAKNVNRDTLRALNWKLSQAEKLYNDPSKIRSDDLKPATKKDADMMTRTPLEPLGTVRDRLEMTLNN